MSIVNRKYERFINYLHFSYLGQYLDIRLGFLFNFQCLAVDFSHLMDRTLRLKVFEISYMFAEN